MYKAKFDLADKRLGVNFFKPFCFLFVTTGIAAFLLYFGIGLIMGMTMDTFPILIIDGYHGAYLREITTHPFPFLSTISFFVALLGSFWIAIIAPKYKRYHHLQLLVLPWVAMFITSPVWGVIWSIYRWPPQSFSGTSGMMLFYRHDALFGLSLGWLSAIISFPINILSYITVCALLFISKRLFLYKNTGQ